MIDEERQEILHNYIDLSKFKEDPALKPNTPFILQLKGFNRQDRINRRGLQLSKGLAGSLQARPISRGAIIGFDKLSDEHGLFEHDIKFRTDLPDPRGIFTQNDTLYVASVDTIYAINLRDGTQKPIHNPWFAYIHSVSGNPDGTRILITSSGFDRLIEIDPKTSEHTWEWVAWDHGYNQTTTTKKTIASSGAKITHKNPALIVDKPEAYPGGLGLPPGDRAAFPNSAIYKNPRIILSTLYHGGLIEIDKATGECQTILSNLKHPHSVQSTDSGYVVTNTADGTFILLNKQLEVDSVVSLKTLPGKEVGCENTEWVQQARPLGNNVYAIVDSHRAQIIFADLTNRTIKKVPFQRNWVIQEFFPIEDNNFQILKERFTK